MKKFKKLLIAFIATFVAMLSLGAISACHTHEFDAWETVTQATCTEEGEKQRECACGEKEIEPIPATGHSFASGICSECNKVDSSYVPPITEGLEYVLNEDGESYSVTGVGTATDLTIVIPSTYNNFPVTGIKDGAFSSCISLTSISIPNTVTSIGKYAFENCIDLMSISIPESVTSISERAFFNCYNLSAITIPSGVTSINVGVFYDCSSLTSIVIPDGVTSINARAFENCSGLKSITIPDSVTSIRWWAFSGCSGLESITIPDSVTFIDGGAFYGCSSLTSISVGEENTYYKSIDGNLYDKDGTILIQYAIGKTATSFEIPDSVTSIDDYAFYNCTSLESITIPNSVTSIDYYAFYGCGRLNRIIFSGIMEEWNTIEKDSSWNISTGNYTIICTDGTLDKDGNIIS